MSKRTAGHGQAWTALALFAAGSLAYVLLFHPLARSGRSPMDGARAPDFVLPVVHGGEPGSRIRLSELRGATVVLDFWATWCSACAEQSEALNATLARLGPERVFILGVATGGDSAAAAQWYAKGHQHAYPSVHDPGGDVAASFQATALPTLVVIDSAGEITGIHRGVAPGARIEAMVREAEARARSKGLASSRPPDGG